ncbi:NAD(P)-dependent oxidoreductase [Arhodomonas aquaeolei]|uniref:NAD(P)-dependent oxidoreductase n=1 Tax=Arhodomonas aquaeolei TaxID=2369 RepID=UPI0021683C19|nr:NAD(P)-dependent oxidoreductase [Arhodomonas aquaeolei]MCS4505914.1 NAD(P)-dependent oxidoreductase [Arhodomonas aquaeolei]
MKVGMIGLGAMGVGMARNLARHDLLGAVWNRTAAKADTLAQELGVMAAPDPAAVAAECEVVLTCVSADADVLEMVDALREGLQPGGVVVDTSTISVATVKTAAERIADAGGRFLDAPVSGGREGAENGQLVVMAGGDAEALVQAMPALEAIGKSVTHMGESGSGQATKAVNQIMVAGINQAVTEALAFGQASGLDMDRVIEVVGGGAAGNWFLSHRGPTMVRGTFEPGFKAALHHKDLGICREMLERMGVSLPVVEMTLKHYERLMEQGHGEEDISTLYRLKQALFEEGNRRSL